MNVITKATKLNLIANLFSGNLEGLRTFKRERKTERFYQWIVINDAAGTSYAINDRGDRYDLVKCDLKKALPESIWRIVEFSAKK